MTARRYLMTGATGTIGGAIARALLARGDTVVGLLRIGADPAALPAGVLPAPVLAPFASTATSYEVQARMAAGRGPFNGMVHCAGADMLAPLGQTTDARWEDAMACAEIALGLLRAASRRDVIQPAGSVLMLTSAVTRRAVAGMGAYAAGKAAVEVLCRTAAVELAPRRVRVNCLAPGAVTGAMHDRLMARLPGAAGAAYEQRHPLGVASPEQVAAAALWMLGAQHITGAVVPVDGGLTA